MTRKRITVSFLLLIFMLIILLALNICIGSVQFSAREIINVLFCKNSSDTAKNIILNIRLPRVLAAVILGGALSVSGYLLQTFFSNPIAGPFVLGISSGAKLTVALTMVCSMEIGFLLNSMLMIVSAFFGAMVSMGFILLISHKVRKSSMLIVGGIMIGYICSAITDFIVTFADDANIVNLHNWSMGSFSGITMNDVKVMAVVVFSAILFTLFISKQISAYRLGEVYAQNLGINIRLFRILLILLSSLLSACVTAYAGPISFVGIAVPHIVKILMKSSKPQLIVPSAFLGGAAFCLLCDLIARVLFAPTELSISTVTAFFGAPIVILILTKKRNTI